MSIVAALKRPLHLLNCKINPNYYSHVTGIFCSKFKFVIIQVPKVGTVSLRRWFVDLEQIKVDYNKPLLGQIPQECYIEVADMRRYPTIGFVRNPWARLVSCYHSKIKRKPKLNDEWHVNGVFKNFASYKVFYAGMSFEEFALRVSKICDYEADVHFKSQSRLLKDRSGNLVTTHLGRIETFAKDVADFSRQVGIENREITHENKSREYDYRDFYNAKLRKMVYRRYREDVETFKYQFS